MSVTFLLSSVGIGSIIGYITNYVAIKLLFRPYKSIKIKNILIFPQGVIPREKKLLAKKVGEVVKEFILSEEEIKKIIKNIKKEIDTIIDEKIDLLLEKKITEFTKKEEIIGKLVLFIESFIKEKFPMFASFIDSKTLFSILENVDFDIKLKKIIDKNKTKDIIRDEFYLFLENEIPKLFIKSNIDKIVEEKVTSFDEKKLEEMLFSLMQKHFSFINIAGAILGAIIGFVQYFIVINM